MLSFSTKSILFCVTVIAIVTAYIVVPLIRTRVAIDCVTRRGASVWYDERGGRHLSVVNVEMDAAFLRALRDLSWVTLDMPECGLSDGQIQYIVENQRELRSLHITGNPIGNKGLEAICASCPLLESIDIPGTDITGEGLRPLYACKRLRRFSVGDSQMYELRKGHVSFEDANRLQRRITTHGVAVELLQDGSTLEKVADRL